MVKSSILYNNETIGHIRKAVSSDRERYAEAAKWWRGKSLEELKGLIFSSDMKRSHFVLSYGDCPLCNKDVPMYEWIIDPFENPWKVKCPHCNKLFPDNEKYKDDGSGYKGKHKDRYMFIGAYLQYGQWEKVILEGIKKLSEAFMATGDTGYSVRAGVLLERLADFFPEYDFMTQGLMYEKENWSEGYISYWCDSCRHVMDLALAYNMISTSLDPDVKIKIEDNIFSDILKNRHKIRSNYPETDMTCMIIKMVLGYNEEEYMKDFHEIISTGTKIDGITGEKGLGSYTTIIIRDLYKLISLISLGSEEKLKEILHKYPVLQKTFKFHINIMYMNRYIPNIGDSMAFAKTLDGFTDILDHNTANGFPFTHSKEWFLYKLYEYYNDSDFLKALYISKNGNIDSLFENDIYEKDNQAMKTTVEEIIYREGSFIQRSAVDYEKYRFAMFFSGDKDNERAIWMNYESGANHSHEDALNIGIYAKGINLLPDNGYPPVNHGGWETDEVSWYRSSMSHNIVSVDGKKYTNLPEGVFLRYPEYGKKLLWCDTDFVKGICAEAREYLDIDRYERMTLMIDISDKDSYFLDIFKVKGGKRHSKFLRGTFSTLESSCSNEIKTDYYGKFMRNFKEGKKVGTFKINNQLHLKYTDLTKDGEIIFCESWVDVSNISYWIPTIITEKESDSSVFLSIVEPYEKDSLIKNITRVDDDENILVSVKHGDYEDLIISCDSFMDNSQYKIQCDAKLCLIRVKNNVVQKVVFGGGNILKIDNISIVDEYMEEVCIVSP